MLGPRTANALAFAALVLAALVAVRAGAIDTDLATVGHALGEGLAGRGDALSGPARVVWLVRLPRVLMAILVGANLGAAGAATQALFRNPLADPYLLGAASGAAFGAVLGWRVREGSAASDLSIVGSAAPGSIVPLFAFLGALGAVVLAVVLSRPRRGLRRESLLLAGVVVSSMLTALTTFILLRDGEYLRAVLSWTLGNLSLASWDHAAQLLPYALSSFGVLFAFGRTLDLLQLGDDTARTLGVRVGPAKWAILATATLATSASIAFVGIIGFVGLVAPHAMRRLGGTRHRPLLLGSALAGGLLLVTGDLAARTVAAPAEIPIGIMLTLVGGPFFLWLLRRT